MRRETPNPYVEYGGKAKKKFAVMKVAQSRQSNKRRSRSVACWLFGCCCILLFSACGMRTHAQRANAMEPTIKAGQRVMVVTLTYKLRASGRWDVIVFKHPERPDLDHEPSLPTTADIGCSTG
jgi:hypothetical protein